MGSPYDINVALRRPPHSRGAGTSNALVWAETVGSSSTGQIDVLQGAPRSYVLLRFESLTPPTAAGDVIGYVAFGADGMPACTADDWPVTHGELWEWCALDPFDRFMRLIREGSAELRVRLYRTDRRE